MGEMRSQEVKGGLTSKSIFINDYLVKLVSVLVQPVLQVHLRGVVRIGTKHHGAVLPVKWEVRYLED